MRSRTRIGIGVVAGAATLIVAGVLLRGDGAAGTEGSVRYVLSWSDGRPVVASAEGFMVTTDLGYQVSVTKATVTTFSVTMTECDHDHSGLLGSLGVFGFLAPRVAEAGHASDHDPALVAGPVVEDIVSAASTRIGSVIVNEPAYCQGHIAFGSTPSSEALAGADVAPTLEVTGTYRTGGTSDFTSFELSTTLGWGKVTQLTNRAHDAVHAEVGVPLEITIIRDRSAIFDGVDFATMSTDDQAMAMLRSLSDSVRFEVTSGTAH